MNTFLKSIIAIALITVFAACGDKSTDDPVVVPANLQVTTDVASDGSGSVSVTATADNAKYFTIYFGETSTETPVIANDGKATHKYAASGSYAITVQANQGISAFITKTQTISVTVGNGNTGNNGDPTIPTEGAVSPTSYDGMTLAWQDEFEGTTLNTADWTYELGNNNGWGNAEKEYYRKENTTVQDGYLIITAKKESYQGFDYTSSRLVTSGKQSFKYGRIDIRAALPEGQGIWPALWMLGSNIGSVGWPASGEIDIMEMIGGSGRENTVYGTLHWDAGGHQCTCTNNGHTLSSGNFHDKFHVFSLDWDDKKITWLIDNSPFKTIDITPAALSEFQNEFFFIFNLAVGGSWPQYPDNTTVFPQQLIVDYVRVFQK